MLKWTTPWNGCMSVRSTLNGLDRELMPLQVANPVALLRMQQRSIDMMQHHQAALTETLQRYLISPREVERAVQQHHSGGNAAYDLMRLGQEVGFRSPQRDMGFNQILVQQRLVGLREEALVPSTTILSDGRQIDQSPTSSRPSSPITTVQNQIERALLDIHRLTNIPPTIPILNNQVKRTNPTSVRGGPYSQIYEGRWLGEKKVCFYVF